MNVPHNDVENNTISFFIFNIKLTQKDNSTSLLDDHQDKLGCTKVLTIMEVTILQI